MPRQLLCLTSSQACLGLFVCFLFFSSDSFEMPIVIFCVHKLFFSLCLVVLDKRWSCIRAHTHTNRIQNHSASAPALGMGHTAEFGLVACLCVWRSEHRLSLFIRRQHFVVIFNLFISSFLTQKSLLRWAWLQGGPTSFFHSNFYQVALLLHIFFLKDTTKTFSNFRKEQNGTGGGAH